MNTDKEYVIQGRRMYCIHSAVHYTQCSNLESGNWKSMEIGNENGKMKLRNGQKGTWEG